MTANENDLRVGLLDGLLRNPHGDQLKNIELHNDILEKDPIFYAHLAMWYDKNGSSKPHPVGQRKASVVTQDPCPLSGSPYRKDYQDIRQEHSPVVQKCSHGLSHYS